MTGPRSEDETTALVQAIVADAERLGLVWTLTPATITAVGNPCEGILDTDVDGGTPIELINLCVMVPAVGARVQVVRIPPAGNYIAGPAVPAPAVASTVLDQFTTTSVAYTTAGTPTPPTCGKVFVAPMSGRIGLSMSAQIVNNSAGQFTIVSYEIVEGDTFGTGTVFTAASDDNCIANQSTVQLKFGLVDLIEGLTPGATYNTQLGHRVTGGTGTILRRKLAVIPAM